MTMLFSALPEFLGTLAASSVIAAGTRVVHHLRIRRCRAKGAHESDPPTH
jgi:hypothetical protein